MFNILTNRISPIVKVKLLLDILATLCDADAAEIELSLVLTSAILAGPQFYNKLYS